MVRGLLICATDAGGARNLAPVAALASANGPVLTMGSTATRPLFAEHGVDAIDPPADEAAAVLQLMQYSPRAVLVGTARYEGSEAWLTRAATNLGIQSLAVLDEWYGYRSRFCGDSTCFTHLPDIICCQDEAARREAEAEGLPAERLRVTGSPALAALMERIRDLEAAPPPRPMSMTDPSAPVVVFLSETHSADYGEMPGTIGPLGPFLGYTEQSVRRVLADVVVGLGCPVAVVEKLHPGADPAAYPPLPGWRTLVRDSLWPLLWHADAVIGMRSMALLEAALMGHRPCSFQPGLIGRERCTAVRLGLAESVPDAAGLSAWLRDRLGNGGRQRPRSAEFSRPDAASAILSLVAAP